MSGIPAGAGSLLGKRLGKYEILALLALGGTAEIYLARIGGAAGFEKYVVVKCLHDHLADDQEFVKMFLDEARLAAHLDHSNIVQTMELGEHENRFYMVMEYLAGLSLAMVVRRANERLVGGLIPVPLVLNMLSQACAGLHYAHEKAMNGKALNIVHRDISPQNLVVSFEGVVKVVDFGIAKAELRETKTRSGTIKGKFAYMSPEQCVAANVDRRTDVFALGIIGHELLTGRRLFKRASPYETYQAVIECAVAPPSKMNVELDSALDEIIMRAVAREKEDRYPTAEAFGDALQRYMHSRGKGSGPGEVGRFFDTSFAQEIDEYGTRMRELIEGRESFSVDTGVNWGMDEEEARRLATLDISRGKEADEKSQLLDSSDIVVMERPSTVSMSEVVDDREPPVDPTRIETNPLERNDDLDAAAHADYTKRAKQAQMTTQLQPHHGPRIPETGALPLPAPPTGPMSIGEPARMAIGKFSEAANLPTMIVEPDPPTAPELAPTQRGAEPIAGLAGSSYPVMSPQMSAQMMRGDVYPSPEPHRQPPPGPYDSQPRNVSPSGPHHAPPLQPLPQAANVMSPVGQQYPQQVDWAAAASIPARAVPPWMLAVLFVVATVVALTLTILIAKIVR